MKSLILLLFVCAFTINAQDYSGKDMEICSEKISISVEKELAGKKINDVVAEIGRTFLGTDYKAFALEKEGDERLVVDLQGLDCTTFLENSLVLARNIKKGDTTFAGYLKELEYVRYRDGKLNGYPSRLHYFSEWIYNNGSKGIVEDITRELGGVAHKFEVGFMSKNPDKYAQLEREPAFVPMIKKQEEEINSREYFYIPKDKVKDIEAQIMNGDLIAITTNLKGLDIGHVGIAVKEKDGRIHFMHAPLAGSKVQISEDPLPGYLAKIKKHTGIIVLRPVEP